MSLILLSIKAASKWIFPFDARSDMLQVTIGGEASPNYIYLQVVDSKETTQTF